MRNECEYIPVDLIRSKIPASLNRYLDIETADIPTEMMPTIEAFWTATKLIAPKILGLFRRGVTIVLSTPPYRRPTGVGTLSFVPSSSETIAVAFENMVLLDLNMLSGISDPELRVASILEEFVHCFMSVSDERLVGQIVALIYPLVTYDAHHDGKYRVAD
jgi:hypothetical protein